MQLHTLRLATTVFTLVLLVHLLVHSSVILATMLNS